MTREGSNPIELEARSPGRSLVAPGVEPSMCLLGGSLNFVCPHLEDQESYPDSRAGEVEAEGSRPPLRSGTLNWAPACLPAHPP